MLIPRRRPSRGPSASPVHSSDTLRLVVQLSLALALTITSSRATWAQAVDPSTWVTNGSVWALHSHSGTLYVGGEFTLVGPATGSAVLVNAATGANSGLFPKVEGIVLTAIRDGVGGWYLGGLFCSVGGVARQNLAHVAADYTV